jgi:hypothetical protein
VTNRRSTSAGAIARNIAVGASSSSTCDRRLGAVLTLVP